MALFRTNQAKTFYVSIKIDCDYVMLCFNNYLLMTFDEKLATAMRSDENFGKLWEEIKSEIKPFGNIFNFNDNNIDTEDSVVTDAYTDTDMNVKQFRTVNEAMLWLQETYSAPHSVNTSKKCIEFAAENGVKIQFVK